jgi:hypothetical protein
MARPPKYASEEDKPVSVTLRLPRDLYDQAQQHAKRRQTTLTELVREGLQLRLETPTDPRDILATQDITVMQEVRQMIADEVQAPLAASAHAPLVGVGRAGGGLRWSSRRPDAPLARRAGAAGAPRVSPQLMHLEL